MSPKQPEQSLECSLGVVEEGVGRVQQAIQRVRNANITTGTTDTGGMRKLWIALSQSPERRKRAKLAGKVKRTILELGGDAKAMEVEFATGTVWMGGHKVSSAAAEKPKDAEKAGAGWVDVPLLAKSLKKSPKDVQAVWELRKAEGDYRGPPPRRVSRTGGSRRFLYFEIGHLECGGLTAQNALEVTHHFAGSPELQAVHVMLLQEIIAEPGVQFHEQGEWVLIFGKNEGDWRRDGEPSTYREGGSHFGSHDGAWGCNDTPANPPPDLPPTQHAAAQPTTGLHAPAGRPRQDRGGCNRKPAPGKLGP